VSSCLFSLIVFNNSFFSLILVKEKTDFFFILSVVIFNLAFLTSSIFTKGFTSVLISFSKLLLTCSFFETMELALIGFSIKVD
tara:strand:+ start:268 stop:516 length:249 start_codon:yes stop_codon:yes gene_type:complete